MIDIEKELNSQEKRDFIKALGALNTASKIENSLLYTKCIYERKIEGIEYYFVLFYDINHFIKIEKKSFDKQLEEKQVLKD